MRARTSIAGILLSVGTVVAGTGTSSDVSEQARIRTHLTRVLGVMAESPPPGLEETQLEARAETMAWLEEYRDAGRFPHNHALEVRTPVFVDPHGAPCAVGYLMLRSGEQALVDEIVREANLARVPDLADDPRLAAWLDSRGITLAEAAMIQPWYGPVKTHTSYGDETVGAAIGTAAVLALVGFTEPPEEGTDWLAWLSLGTAVGNAVLLHALAQENEEASMPSPTVEMAVSGAGALASLVAAVRRWDHPPAPREEPAASLVPLLDPLDGRAGLALRLRFRH